MPQPGPATAGPVPERSDVAVDNRAADAGAVRLERRKDRRGRLTQVGHEPLRNRGMNAALAVHEDYAYVGSVHELDGPALVPVDIGGGTGRPRLTVTAPAGGAEVIEARAVDAFALDVAPDVREVGPDHVRWRIEDHRHPDPRHGQRLRAAASITRLDWLKRGPRVPSMPLTPRAASHMAQSGQLSSGSGERAMT